MAKHQQVQLKVQTEIASVIEKDQTLKLTDRNKLPYTDSVLNEILRFGAIVPAIARSATNSVRLRNYYIPAKTVVFANLFTVFRDPAVWNDAAHFNPEANFPVITDNSEKQLYQKSVEQQLIAFGMGKRVCLGENLARQEFFLFFTELMHNFSVVPDTKSPLPSEFDGTPGITRGPLPFRVCFSSRN